MTVPTDIPQPLAGRHVRVHSGASVGVCTGVTTYHSDGLYIEIRWAYTDGGTYTTFDHVHDVVWLSTIADLDA